MRFKKPKRIGTLEQRYLWSVHQYILWLSSCVYTCPKMRRTEQAL